MGIKKGGNEMDKKEMKARKKAFKKAKRKAIRPWRFLTWLSLPLAIILVAATVIVSMFDNTIALFVELQNLQCEQWLPGPGTGFVSRRFKQFKKCY